MADNRSGSNQSTPLVLENEVEHEHAHFVYTLGEHRRLKKIFPFFRKTDELETNIYEFVKSILDIEPTQGTVPFELSDVSDMIQSFCQPDQVLTPEFFDAHHSPFAC